MLHATQSMNAWRMPHADMHALWDGNHGYSVTNRNSGMPCRMRGMGWEPYSPVAGAFSSLCMAQNPQSSHGVVPPGVLACFRRPRYSSHETVCSN